MIIQDPDFCSIVDIFDSDVQIILSYVIQVPDCDEANCWL